MSILVPIKRKANTWLRTLLVHGCSGMVPYYIINEYPKSGGTWLGQMLSEALDVPFPRNTFPVLRPSIMHGHYLSPLGMKNVVLVWRDGRDVMVSWYYHCLFAQEVGNDRLVKKVRHVLGFEDYEDIRSNLPKFMEYSFTRQTSPGFSWAQFVRKWCDAKSAVHVRYEDLHANAPAELKRIVFHLTGESMDDKTASDIAKVYSFENLTERSPGEESRSSFLRKGIVGDWKNCFSPEAREVFARHAGDELIRLGYEKNGDWVMNIESVV